MAEKDSALSRPRIKLVLKHPFFAALAMHLTDVEVDEKDKHLGIAVPTAATDGVNLLYNRKWIESLDEEEKLFIIAHEVMHLALGHLWRRGTRNPERWNVAADYCINWILKECGLKMPRVGLIDEKWKELGAESIYDKLPPNLGGKKALDILIEGADGGGEGDEEGKEGGESPGNGSKMDKDEAESMWRARLAEAATVAKMMQRQGTMPAGLARLLKELLEPKLRWDQLLDQIACEVTRDDYDESHPDRRFFGREGTDDDPIIYLPDLYTESRKVIVVLDTSGSRGEDDLRIAASESLGILRSRGVTEVRFMACDAEIHLDTVVKATDPLPDDFPGGGGTSFCPPFERIAKELEKPALLVYFTDAWGDFPKQEPDYPVLWVVNNGKVEEVPWGMTVQYEQLSAPVTKR